MSVFCFLFCFICFVLFLLTTKNIFILFLITYVFHFNYFIFLVTIVYFIKVYLFLFILLRFIYFIYYKKMNIDAPIEKIQPKFIINFYEIQRNLL